MQCNFIASFYTIQYVMASNMDCLLLYYLVLQIVLLYHRLVYTVGIIIRKERKTFIAEGWGSVYIVIILVYIYSMHWNVDIHHVITTASWLGYYFSDWCISLSNQPNNNYHHKHIQHLWRGATMANVSTLWLPWQVCGEDAAINWIAEEFQSIDDQVKLDDVHANLMELIDGRRPVSGGEE